MWHALHIHRHWKLQSGPPLTGNTLSQAITSSLTHSHLFFSVIWFNLKYHQKGFHRPTWQTLNSHLFLIGVRCLPFSSLKTSHHVTSNKGKIFANPLQKYWSSTDCSPFSHKHARTLAKASKCKTQIYTRWCIESSSQNGIELNDYKRKCSWKGAKWEVSVSATSYWHECWKHRHDRPVEQCDSHFSHVLFPLQHISQVPRLS